MREPRRCCGGAETQTMEWAAFEVVGALELRTPVSSDESLMGYLADSDANVEAEAQHRFSDGEGTSGSAVDARSRPLSSSSVATPMSVSSPHLGESDFTISDSATSDSVFVCTCGWGASATDTDATVATASPSPRRTRASGSVAGHADVGFLINKVKELAEKCRTLGHEVAALRGDAQRLRHAEGTVAELTATVTRLTRDNDALTRANTAAQVSLQEMDALRQRLRELTQQEDEMHRVTLENHALHVDNTRLTAVRGVCRAVACMVTAAHVPRRERCRDCKPREARARSPPSSRR